MVFAKNNITSKEFIEGRERYDKEARDWEGLLYGDDQLLDIWHSASQNYGKVDLKNMPVYPSESRMVHYGEAKVFDFVATALDEMKEFVNTSILSQTLDPSEGNLFPIEYPRGYIGVHGRHISYLQRKVNTFLKKTSKPGQDRDIIGHQEFFDSFLSHIRETEEKMLFTKNKYQTSKLGSPAMTGLFIETKDLPHDLDANKISIISDNNFPYFVEAARRHGFFVDRNAPWRLVVDIRSCYMRNLMKQNGIDNLADFFDEYYSPFHSSDFVLMKETLYGLWNSYCAARPLVDTLTETKCGFGIMTHKRKPLSSIDSVSRLQWSKLYIKIRIEEAFGHEDKRYCLDLLSEVDAYFGESNWEELVAEHVEKKIIRKQTRNSLTSAANIYKIIDKDCPDLIVEEQPESVECDVDNDSYTGPGPYQPEEDVVFPDYIEDATSNVIRPVRDDNEAVAAQEEGAPDTSVQADESLIRETSDLPPGTDRQ